MLAPSFFYRTALITGASSGIGANLAAVAAPYCENLVLIARRASLLDELSGRLAGCGTKVHVLAADVTDHKPFQQALRTTLEPLPPIDLAVLNAGIAYSPRRREGMLPAAQDIFAVNFFGMLATLDVVLPAMLAAECGHLVGMASVAAYRGIPTAAPYCASKAALWRYFEALRCELAATPLRLSTIHPGFIDTPMVENLPFRVGRFDLKPWLVMDGEKAAALIWKAIRRRKTHYCLPATYRWGFRLLRLIPDSLFYRIFKRQPHKSKRR